MVSFTLDAIKFLLIYRHLQNTYWFKRGSHTFAHPIIWPWLPIVKDKQLQLAHVRMICSTTPRLYEDVDDRIVIISGRSRCRFFFTINQIAKFDDRRKTSSNVLICLSTHPRSQTSSIKIKQPNTLF